MDYESIARKLDGLAEDTRNEHARYREAMTYRDGRADGLEQAAREVREMAESDTESQSVAAPVPQNEHTGVNAIFGSIPDLPEPAPATECKSLSEASALQEAIEWLIELGADDTHKNARKIERLAAATRTTVCRSVSLDTIRRKMQAEASTDLTYANDENMAYVRGKIDALAELLEDTDCGSVAGKDGEG